MIDGLRVGVVGATGAVGRELLSILEKRNFPVDELVPFASERSKGKPLSWKDNSIPCRILEPGCFRGIGIVFFDASDAISKTWVPQAVEEGAWVVDNSATFRMQEDVLLLVPEVNGDLLESRLKSKGIRDFSPREKILSGPNCSTVQLVMALKPIRDRWGIRRVVVSTYQSTSGAGTAAKDELRTQTQDVLNHRSPEPKLFPHQIAFNCIPHIGGFDDSGTTSEERKMVSESQKILDLPQLKISATAVRVPTFSCHGESVNVECDSPFQLEEVYSALRRLPGLVVLDDPKRNLYPLGLTSGDDPVENATGRDAVYVGRLRRDPSVENGLNFWVVSDNLRKGAALNAIQVGEILLKSLR